MLKTLTLCAAFGAALVATSAQAATEEECIAAVTQTQKDMQDHASAMSEPQNIQDEWARRLEEAAGKGQNGEADDCLADVKGIRAQAGLE